MEKETDLTFTIKTEDLNKTKKIIKDNKGINFRKLLFEKEVSKISIIGVGMITTPGVTFRMFQALANKKIKYSSNFYIRNKNFSFDR